MPLPLDPSTFGVPSVAGLPVVGGMIPDLTAVLPGLLFAVFAGIIALSCLLAAFSGKIVHAAFGLMAAFFGVAAMYALLGSDFLALTQVIVYVGGILILIVFGVLLTGRAKSQLGLARPIGRMWAAATGLVLFVALALAIWTSDFGSTVNSGSPVKLDQLPDPAYTTAQIGRALLDPNGYLFPFEFVSVFLLVSLIGAAYLVRRKREGA